MQTTSDPFTAAWQALCFLQCLTAAFLFHVARASATPTEQSIAATRQSMRAQGLGGMLSTRAKPTADERREAEHIARTRALGFDRGRFVGGAA